MRGKKVSVGWIALWVLVAATQCVTSTTAAGQQATGKILHNFDTNKLDGLSPSGGLLFDSAGNLYGTTFGVRGGFGAVYELTPTASGFWNETTLHIFSFADGVSPNGTLIFDAVGNLYGVAAGGGLGTGTRCTNRAGGCGTVFELSPSASGWTETVLHDFTHNIDGANPRGGLVMDAAGNLYGTTTAGGGNSGVDFGTVFELSPMADGEWMETILHIFKNNGHQDGLEPNGSLVFDAAGNLYGTTVVGGSIGFGTVFELSPQIDGSWQETILSNFAGQGDGLEPFSGVIFDASGNLYGTTSSGGTGSGGTVFELSPSLDGSWTKTVLYNFSNENEGSVGMGSLTLDGSGNLYGATEGDSCGHGCGAIFELSNSGGLWTKTTLFRFDGKDGDNPYASLIFDAAGNLYGTTAQGGSKEEGTVFELVP